MAPWLDDHRPPCAARATLILPRPATHQERHARFEYGAADQPDPAAELAAELADPLLVTIADGGAVSRVAIVTGGGSGVGRSICEHLGRQGHRVAAADLDGDAAAATAEALRSSGADAIAVSIDVADRASVDAAFADVRRALGPIEILVTSAAVAGFVAFQELTERDWSRTIAVNLTGTFHCMQAAIGDMVEGGWGRIVTISSAAGQAASPRQAHYSASKGGVIALTKTVAAEVASKQITVNTVAPFTVDTPMLRAALDEGFLPPLDVLARMIPARRLGTGDDIAAVCAFLCTQEAGYVTGQVIAVNGGALT